MTLITWDAKYSTGIEHLDYQHEKLFFMANHLYDAMQRGVEQDILGEILVELVEYISYHFATEEAYMQKHRFPGYDAHRQEHDLLRNRAMDLFDDFGKGGDALSAQVMNFLKEWLQDHIIRSDMCYAHYLENSAPCSGLL